jgi:small GTP-binding protein
MSATSVSFTNQQCRITVAGAQGVGKTRLLERLSAPPHTVKLSENIPRVMDACTALKQNSQATSKALMVFNDTYGGFEEHTYARMRPLNYYGSFVILVAFSVTDRASFEELPRYLDEADSFCHGTPIIVVGTKIDARKDANANDDETSSGVAAHVTTEEARAEIVRKRDLHYVEVSAESNDNMDELVDLLFDGVVCKERGQFFEPSTWTRSAVGTEAKRSGFISSVRRVFGFGSGTVGPRQVRVAAK